MLAKLLSLALLASAAPSIDLRDTAGAIHKTSEWSAKKAAVFFFVMTDCPVANSYVPEMNRIRADYESRGVSTYAVMVENGESADDIRKHIKEFGYTFPVLLDPKKQLARMTGAKVVPEVAVLSPAGDVRYLGRIDNRVEDFGKKRQIVTQTELRDALDAILAGGAPKVARTRAVGCSISLENK